MKKILFSIVLCFSAVAGAFIETVPTQYPTESGWGKYVISKACGIKSSSLKDASIIVSEQGSKTVYVAILNDQVVGEAVSFGGFLWSEAECLSDKN
jgi:hypothetical protein